MCDFHSCLDCEYDPFPFFDIDRISEAPLDNDLDPQHIDPKNMPAEGNSGRYASACNCNAASFPAIGATDASSQHNDEHNQPSKPKRNQVERIGGFTRDSQLPKACNPSIPYKFPKQPQKIIITPDLPGDSSSINFSGVNANPVNININHGNDVNVLGIVVAPKVSDVGGLSDDVFLANSPTTHTTTAIQTNLDGTSTSTSTLNREGKNNHPNKPRSSIGTTSTEVIIDVDDDVKAILPASQRKRKQPEKGNENVASYAHLEKTWSQYVLPKLNAMMRKFGGNQKTEHKVRSIAQLMVLVTKQM